MYKIFLVFIFVANINAQMLDGLAIVVKGKAITLYDIKKEMKLSKVDSQIASDLLIRKKLEEVEIENRKISVSNSEVYDDIKKTASRNNMNVSQFYEAVMRSNGINSTDLKIKIKEKLLSQKLYASIAYSVISEPSEDDIKEYYTLHKDEFIRPKSFDVVIYHSEDRLRLAGKINNPMFDVSEITTQEQELNYNQIAPQLAQLLSTTPLNNFTKIVPDGKGGYISFYLKNTNMENEVSINELKNEIINILIAQMREKVLGDYFARLKDNAEINIIRMVD